MTVLIVNNYQGAGFTREERQIFGLEGFLPYDVHSLEKQCLRAYNQLCKVSQILFIPVYPD